MVNDSVTDHNDKRVEVTDQHPDINNLRGKKVKVPKEWGVCVKKHKKLSFSIWEF